MRSALAALAFVFVFAVVAPAAAKDQLIVVAAQTMRDLPRPWFDPAHQPETPDEQASRIGRVTARTVEAAITLDEENAWARATGLKLVDLVAMSLTLAYNESALAYEVHAGVEVPGRPKPFGDNGRAACLFQLQRSAALVPFPAWRPFEEGEWAALVGLDDEATARCARAGVRAVAYHAWRCRSVLRRNVRAGDLYWVAAIVFSEYHRPSRYGSLSFCKTVSSQALSRAHAYKAVRGKILRELREAALQEQKVAVQ